MIKLDKKAWLISLLMICTSVVAWAYDINDYKGFSFSMTSDSTVTVVDYCGDNYTNIVIPSTAYSAQLNKTYKVTSISQFFIPNSSIKSVTIPNSIIIIGEKAFKGFSGLTSITIPNSVQTIGSGAFYGCSSLTTVTIGTGVKTIGTGDVYEEGNGNPIHYGVFEGTHLTRVEFGSVESLCDINFEREDSNPLCFANHLYINGVEIKDLVIPNSETSIHDYTFTGCSCLKSVTIPNSVTSIGSYAFQGCSGLTSLTIPNSVTSIGSYAFQGCSGLTSVTIPNSVTSIGSYAFQGCSRLTSVTIPNSVTSIGGGAFFGCSGLTSVTIPNSVTSIGSYAFQGCSRLTNVTIPNSVTSIGSSAFYYCI